MSNLTPLGRELVDAGRARLRPTSNDRERVLEALLPKLGSAMAASLSTPTQGHSPLTKSQVIKALATLSGVALVTSAVLLVSSEHRRAQVPQEVTSAAVPLPPPVLPALRAAAPASAAHFTAPQPDKSANLDLGSTSEATTAVPRASVAVHPAAGPSPSDNLAKEIAILGRAGAALHGGRPAEALTLLAAHQRDFPRGVLAEERRAARVQALCGLGRMQEAKTELTQLARSSPNSPLTSRARKACGIVEGSPEK